MTLSYKQQVFGIFQIEESGQLMMRHIVGIGHRTSLEIFRAFHTRNPRAKPYNRPMPPPAAC